MSTIITVEQVYQQLEHQSSYISVVELAMMLEAEASASEVRQRLNELGHLVQQNEQDEWRVVGNLVQKLELSPLSQMEVQERDELENTVQQAFLMAGQALKTLRDKRLYRETHSTFESYIRDRFDFTKRKAYYLIDAFEIVNNLKSEPMVHLLPTNERQCREIAKLPAQKRGKAWSQAIEEAGGKVPPARIVKQVVTQIKGESEMKLNKDGIVRLPGIGIEYVAHLDEETYWMLKDYKNRLGVATFNGAIRRLLDKEKQRNNLD
jgi:hypothetical protein